MSSRVLIFLLMAMVHNNGTLGFVFGPLAMFTTSQETSTPVVTSARPVITTPDVRRRPPIRRPPTPVHVARDPTEMRFVFPSDDDNEFPSFDRPTNNNPKRTPHDNADGMLVPKRQAGNADGQTDSTDTRLSAGVLFRPTQSADDAIVFDGPSSSKRFSGKERVRPNWFPQGRPPVVPPVLPPVMSVPDREWTNEMSTPPEAPPPCMCPTTSESNPVCAEIEGSRVQLLNTSELKCAQICSGSSVKLLFHGTCRRSIVLLRPFIHD